MALIRGISSKMRRSSVDALRGFVILLMALDHTQFFWSAHGLPNDGLGGLIPIYASGFHQFTRFLSHICAPTFLFLAGMMMVGKTNRLHLMIRALLLIALQFTLENFAWWPKTYLDHGYSYFGILSCIGISMLIVLAFSFSRPGFILALSILSIAAAQIIQPDISAESSIVQAFEISFYVPTLYPAYPLTSLFPVMHWFGFMGLGYYFGSKTVGRELSQYKSKLLQGGAVLVGAAFGLRLFNGFGNRIHWHGEPFGADFFILSKYPPCLVYIFLTLGLMLMIFSAAIHFEARFHSKMANPLITFGQNSLFFYLSHLFLYGAVAYVLGRNVEVSLLWTWGVWIMGLIPLYFLCQFYREWKLENPRSIFKYI